VLAHLLFCWYSSNRLPHPAVPRWLLIFIAHCTSFRDSRHLKTARFPVAPFCGINFAWPSLVCLDVCFFICRFSLMHFHCDQKRRCSCCCSCSLRLIPIRYLRVALLLTSLLWLHLPIFSQLSAALSCSTNKAWGLSQGCRVMPRQRPLVPDGSNWILLLFVPSSSAAFSFFPADSYNKSFRSGLNHHHF